MYARSPVIRGLSWVPLVVVALLFLFEAVCYAYIFLYMQLVQHSQETALAIVLGIVAFILWVFAIWSYFACALRDPGLVPGGWRHEAEEQHFPCFEPKSNNESISTVDTKQQLSRERQSIQQHTLDDDGGERPGVSDLPSVGETGRQAEAPRWRTSQPNTTGKDAELMRASICTPQQRQPSAKQQWHYCSSKLRDFHPHLATRCAKCGDLLRPERAHHCSVCGVCVMRMDHHCPWLGNCVGFGNHKEFVLFNLYCCLLCIFLAASAGPWVTTEFILGGSVSSDPAMKVRYHPQTMTLLPADPALIVSYTSLKHLHQCGSSWSPYCG